MLRAALLRAGLVLVLALSLGVGTTVLRAAPAMAVDGTFGNVATAEWSQRVGIVPGAGFGCTVAGYWIVTPGSPDTQRIKYSYQCDTGPLSDDVRVAISFADDQDVCQGYNHLGNIDETAQQNGQGVFDPGAASGSCGAVTELCFHYDMEFVNPVNPGTAPFDQYKSMECVAWPLGAPPEAETGIPSGTCPTGIPSRTVVTVTADGVNSNMYAWKVNVSGSVAPSPTGVATRVVVYVLLNGYAPDVAADEQWRAELVKAGSGDASTGIGRYTTAAAAASEYAGKRVTLVGWNFSAPAEGGSFNFAGRVQSANRNQIQHPRPEVNVVGSGVMGIDVAATNLTQRLEGNAPIMGGPTPWGASSLGDGNPENPPPGGMGVAAGGLTSPNGCAWYWGAPVASLAGYDAPVGPLEGGGGEPQPEPNIEFNIECSFDAVCIEPPNFDPPEDDGGGGTNPDDPDDGSSCGDGFKLWNPMTWVSAGFCSIVAAIVALTKVVSKLLGIFKDVLEAIVGLVGKIIEGIMGLFIPDPSVFSDAFDALFGIFDDSPVGSWTDGLGSGLSPPTTGGCEGPTFSLEGMPYLDAAPDMKPFSACSPGAANAASLVRTVTTVVISIGGGFLMLRMILTSLGIRTAAPGAAGGGRE